MKPFVFVVSAISGGGKTTVTRELQKRLPNAKALYFDDRNYDSDSGINDICEWCENGADVNLFNLERLANDIDKLKQETLDFIVMDYPFGYRHKQIAPYIHCSIFIDTPLDIALARRILRDYNKETVTSIFGDMEFYLKKGRKAYLNGLEKVKQTADFLVDGSLTIDCIVKSISEKVIKIKGDNFCPKA